MTFTQTETNVPVWTVGDRMRKARREAGLERKAIAEYLGVTPSAVSRFELRKNAPRLGTLRLWAQRCDVPLQWLIYGEIPPGPKARSEGSKSKAEQAKRDNGCSPDTLVKTAA